MPILLECLSHTPLAGYYDPAPDVVAEVERVQRRRALASPRSIQNWSSCSRRTTTTASSTT